MSAVKPPPRSKPAPQPRVGFVSLGCPKALVDSEQILTRLRAEGYETSKTFAGADLVIHEVDELPGAVTQFASMAG